MLIKEVNGKFPQIPDDCYVAENATIVGDVILGTNCSVWFNAVIRGDVNSIVIGNKVNIQDGAIIHCTYEKHPTIIGNNVSIGHNAIVHGCTIKDNVLIGMGAIVMDNCVIESNSIVAAGSVITQNTIVESGSIYAGVPAKKVKDIDQSDFAGEIQRISNEKLITALTMVCPFQPNEKQAILEIPSLQEQSRLVQALLEHAIVETAYNHDFSRLIHYIYGSYQKIVVMHF
jgi:carbonic anhydrase/acetyltransferase-like protein (isoleucine patch superfamily)